MSELTFYDRLARIDMALKAGPQECDFARDIAPYVSELASRDYFYAKVCKNSEWFDVLLEAGEFSDPPGLQTGADGSSRAPRWPQSNYLTTIAESESVQRRLLDLVLKLATTDNPSIRQDIVETALGMQGELTAEIVPAVRNWIDSPNSLLPPAEQLGYLVGKLTKDGKGEEAFALAESLLAVLPAPKLKKTQQPRILSGVRRPRAHFDSYRYRELVESCCQSLLDADPTRTLTLFCDLLEQAVKLSHENDIKPDDYSYIWRPAIEDHHQNSGRDIRDALVVATRDSAFGRVQGDRSTMAKTVCYLEGREWCVFRRIALFLLSKFPKTDPGLVPEHLSNINLFGDYRLRHEYSLLAKAGFADMDSKGQAAIMGWIKKGPSEQEISSYKEAVTNSDSEGVSEPESGEYVRQWQAKRLALFGDALHGPWKEWFDGLVNTIGRKPAHPDFVTYVSIGRGGGEPIPIGKILAMSIDDLLEYCRTWRPGAEEESGSGYPVEPESLASALRRAVTKKPDHFAPVAERFSELGDIRYIHPVLSGMSAAAREKRTFQWGPVLNLCSWVIEHTPSGEDAEEKTPKEYPNWRWARSTIADLLETGFREEESRIPKELREKAWSVLYPLTSDPDPTPERETQEAGGSDLLDISINSVRGKAMDCVIHYALWRRRMIEAEADSEKRIEAGFGEMPEVRQVLEERLVQETEPARCIRAVYGRWFPWLTLLDKKWATRHVPAIFPGGDDDFPMWRAAWNAYIRFCAAYNDVFGILRQEYRRAITRIDQGSSEEADTEGPDGRLVDHLMTFYSRGLIELDGMLLEFYRRAPVGLRKQAIGTVGTSLTSTEGDVPPDIEGRLQAFFNIRLLIYRMNPSAPDRTELEEFGWWFGSGKLDATWCLDRLKRVLAITGKVEPDNIVLERLVSIAKDEPLDAVTCLLSMVQGDQEGWWLYGAKDEIRTILAAAQESGDHSAQDKAVETINLLGERGRPEYRDLLSLRNSGSSASHKT